MSYFTHRAFIGPAWLVSTSPYFFDWSDNTAGSVLSPDPTPTTTTATLNSGGTTLQVAAFGTYPAAGSVFVGPNGVNEGWEVVKYSSKDSNNAFGLGRESTSNRDHNGVHTSGAVVRFWWPTIEFADDKLSFSHQIDDLLAVSSWTATLSGVYIPQAAIRNNHIIVIQSKTTPGGTFANLLVGWLSAPNIKDDYRKTGEWSVQILSAAGMIAQHEIAGIRAGELDIAKHGSANASSVLGNPNKERASGDYKAANPSFSADQALNEDANAPWLGDRYIGTENTVVSGGTGDPAAGLGIQITQMYINPPAGTRGGSRWFELTTTEDTNVLGLTIVLARTLSPGYKQWTWKGPGYLEIGSHIIFCEDEDVFAEDNPSSGADVIYEWEEFFPSFDPTSGHMAIRMLSGAHNWLHDVKWGDGTQEITDYFGSGTPSFWDGPRIPAPAQGETMRYIYDPAGTPTDPVDWWEVGNVQSPGYDIDTSPDEWLQVELPGMGLVLRDDITDTYPGVGDVLYINNDSGPSNEGLYVTSTVQIGSEQITTSAKEGVVGMVVAARGANSTTAAVHVAGDSVFVVDTDGTATDAHHIKEISVQQLAGGTIYPKAFSIKVSNLPGGARTPSDGNDYNNDYTELVNPTTNALSVYTHTLSPSARVKTILIKIARMTTDPARARISKLTALVNEDNFSADRWIMGGDVGDVMTAILTQANIPADAIIVSSVAAAPEGHSTEKGDALSVLTSFAEYTGFRVDCGRDSKFTISNELGNFWITASPSFSETWDRSNSATCEIIQNPDAGVSQVSLEWRTADGTDEGTVTFPAEPDTIGSVLEIGPFIYADATDALQSATRRYYMEKYNHTLVIECAGYEPGMEPGQIHKHQWQFNANNPEMNRLYVVKSADHAFDKNIASTVLTLAQIDRTENW